MAESPWNPNLPLIRDGEAVDANTTNRPILAGAANAQYLKDRVDSAALGESIRLYGASLSAAVLPDMPVAFNVATSRFEPAIAGFTVDTTGGGLGPGPLADCIGICAGKDGPEVGTIVCGGRVRTTLVNAVAGTPTPGRYYLSSAVAGQLVRQSQPVSVAVLYWDGTYAYVTPSIKDFAESHVHYRFELTCRPAGGQYLVSGHRGVASPDVSLPGWLPANDASFAGQAPRGAAFGYNLAQDPKLSAVWPPLPLSSAVVVWDKGVSQLGGAILPQGTDGLIYLDKTTLWWMSDCDGDTPWPSSYDPLNPPVPAGPNSSLGPECPRAEDMRLYLAFTEMLFATNNSVVTDLRPVPGSSITVTDCDGKPGNSGSLEIGLDLNFLVDPTPVQGGVAFKQLNGTTFQKGPIVEGLFPGANVTLSSPSTLAVASQTLYQGRVTIDVNTNLSERELAPQVIRLVNAEERPFQNILYIGFPQSKASAIRMRFNIPYQGLPATPTAAIRATIYGKSTGTLPVTSLDYIILPRPVVGTPVAVPASTTVVAMNTNVAIGANQYVEVESSPIVIQAGDTLIVNFSRAANDGYADEIGLIRIGAVLSAG